MPHGVLAHGNTGFLGPQSFMRSASFTTKRMSCLSECRKKCAEGVGPTVLIEASEFVPHVRTPQFPHDRFHLRKIGSFIERRYDALAFLFEPPSADRKCSGSNGEERTREQFGVTENAVHCSDEPQPVVGPEVG